MARLSKKDPKPIFTTAVDPKTGKVVTDPKTGKPVKFIKKY